MVSFSTRGVVLNPDDLSLADWPERAARAGLTTIALHPFPGDVETFIATDAGQSFLAQCEKLGLEVEYELHAARELLPRDLFANHPELFRMDEAGKRVADWNLCVHSPQALEIAGGNARRLAKALRPNTHRYFLWGDDNVPWCRCPHCRDLSDSDQALTLENMLLAAIRQDDPKATLAHLAYMNTLPPPQFVRPAPGIFLEFAPIQRRYDVPYEMQSGPKVDSLDHLDANLKLFPKETAQVLEYWLDVSRFSQWKRPSVPLDWHPSVLRADLTMYARRGVHQVTSFAVWIDADWVQRHGEPPLADYGAALRNVGQKVTSDETA